MYFYFLLHPMAFLPKPCKVYVRRLSQISPPKGSNINLLAVLPVECTRTCWTTPLPIFRWLLTQENAVRPHFNVVGVVSFGPEANPHQRFQVISPLLLSFYGFPNCASAPRHFLMGISDAPSCFLAGSASSCTCMHLFSH